MIYLVFLCLALVAALVILLWKLLEERDLNHKLKDANNSLNGVLVLVARLERHVREQNSPLALDTLITIVHALKANKDLWHSSEFVDLGPKGYAASRARQILHDYTKSEPSLSVASGVIHATKQLSGMGLHVGTAQVDVVLKKLKIESAKATS